MKKTIEILKKSLLILAFIIIWIIVFLPIMIIYLFAWIQSKRLNREYHEYLKTLNGKNFFCYNNRKKGFEFIEKEILPNLPTKVEPIYLNGRKIECEKYESRFLSKAFDNFKNYNRFPHLFKVRDGQTYDCSLNAELFNCLSQGKNRKLIYDRINTFFELDS